VKTIAAIVRTWHGLSMFTHEISQDEARQALIADMLDQVDEQGYELAPHAEPVVERFEKAPWQETIWGQNPETGEWIGHPDDYGLRGYIRVIAKGLVTQPGLHLG
jgi:hypothetical protein